jgi:hypothetical protein
MLQLYPRSEPARISLWERIHLRLEELDLPLHLGLPMHERVMIEEGDHLRTVMKLR